MSDTLYDRLGGFPAISSVVTRFYELILADDSLAPYFAGVDMGRLMDHQTKFLCGVTGGPQTYDGRDLKKAHAHMKITEKAFNSVAGHLVQALTEHDIPEADINIIVGVVGGAKGDVVTA